MPLLDQRQSIDRSIFGTTSRTLSPEYLLEVERFFDHPNASDDILLLLNHKLLQGREVITHRPRIAPPANLRVSLFPDWRKTLGTPSVSPYLDMEISWGWENVSLFPEGTRTLFFPQTDLTELRQREWAPDTDKTGENRIPHQVWIDGENYEIEQIVSSSSDGSRVLLIRPLPANILSFRRGTIHNGAEGAQVLFQSDGNKKTFSYSDPEKNVRKSPVTGVRGQILEGFYAIFLSFLSPLESRVFHMERDVRSPSWADPLEGEPEAYYISVAPPPPKEEMENALNKAANILTLQCTFAQRPEDSPGIVGFRYWIRVPNKDQSKGVSNTIFLSSKMIQTQEGPQRTPIQIPIEDLSPNTFRILEGSFFDAMGRDIQNFRIPVSPGKDSIFVPTPSLRDLFSDLVNVSALPLSVSPSEIDQKVDKEMSRMKRYAEGIVNSHASTDVILSEAE